MKYRNASEILPDKLLKEIQKYTSGEAIYIPAAKKRKKWGESSGAKVFFEQRNNEIRFKFSQGATIYDLSDEYYLSVETIKRVLYTKYP